MEAFITLSFSLFVIINADGWGKLLGIGMLIMPFLALVSWHRGWKIDYSIPPRAYTQLARGGISAEVAQAAIDATIKDRDNPNRKRFAFDKEARP